jgi:hypothetical protein
VPDLLSSGGQKEQWPEEEHGRPNQRLDQTNHRLERVEQGLIDLGGFMKQLALELTNYERFHAHHVELLEKDVQDLKERLLRVEDRLAR